MTNIIETHIVPDGVADARLEKYALGVFNTFPTKKSVRKAIKRGEIRINGNISEPGHWIEQGQCLELIDSPVNRPKPFQLPLRVIYEDDWLAIVEKPAGFPVNGNHHKTIENALQFNLKPSNQPDTLKWPRPVHRLDNPVGGLLIAAKTALAQVRLGWQFQERKIQKRYRAIVIGRLEKFGFIKKTLDGRDSSTKFLAVEHVPSLKNKWLTLIDVWPITGRQHQLRRHLRYLGFPVLGDKLYGEEGKILKGKGLFLWAVELSLTHPTKGWILNIRIKEAPKFSSLLEREERRWKKYQ